MTRTMKIMGEDGDNLGAAGIVAPVMNISAISEAILTLARDPEMRREMGQVGYERLMRKYRIEYMTRTYRSLYNRLGRQAGATALIGEGGEC